MTWTRKSPGVYSRVEDEFDILVFQKGELWVSAVHCSGELVDQGEWDGRGTAFRNAIGAMKRARQNRAPLWEAKKIEQTEDEDE